MKPQLISTLLILFVFFSCDNQDYDFYEINPISVSFEEINKTEIDNFINKLIANPALLKINQYCYKSTIEEKIKSIDASLHKSLAAENAFSPTTMLITPQLLTLSMALKTDSSSVEVSKIDYTNNTAYLVIDYRGIFEIIGLMINKNNNTLSIFDLIDLKQGFSLTDIEVYELINSKGPDRHLSENFNKLSAINRKEILNWGSCQKKSPLIDRHSNEFVLLKNILPYISLLNKEKKISTLEKFITSYGDSSPVSAYHEFMIAKTIGRLDSSNVSQLKALIGDSKKLDQYLQ